MVSIYWTSKDWLIVKLGWNWIGPAGKLFEFVVFYCKQFFQNRSWIIQIWGGPLIFKCLFVYICDDASL